MSLVRLRRRAAPVSVGTFVVFLLSLLPARPARADERARVETATAEHAGSSDATPHPSAPRDDVGAAAPTAVQAAVAQPGPGAQEGESSQRIKREVDTTGVSQALAVGAANSVEAAPIGGDKTGVSSQAISVPQGSGKIQGMGESFSTDLSTGVASLGLPFTLPAARGNVQPTLALSYSSASGNGVVGLGWDLTVSFIARQTDRGLPQYADPAGGGWSATQDRFVFNGGQELVPICVVSGSDCTGKLTGEMMPLWADGWEYFRPRVEQSFLRFFWSLDHRTWRVQSKSGATMEFGVPLAAPSDYGPLTNPVESDPANPDHIYRWNISREYDTHTADSSGAPANVIVYQYTSPNGGLAYLSDVYDTPLASSPASATLAQYAHHVRLSYDFSRPDPVTSYRRGWATVQSGRLIGVDVASQTFGVAATRQLVRRYHLTYDPGYHVSLLQSVQMEGRCAEAVTNCTGSISEDSSGGFPANTGFIKLPATTFAYQHVNGYDTSGHPLSAGVAGYEPFDERIRNIANSPDHSLDETLTDLFDVNSDGLPDVVVTAPYLYNGNHAVFFNGAGGADTFGAWQPMQVIGVNGESANDIRLDNPNISALDATGDGVIDLVNMPEVKTYSIYTPTQQSSGVWAWSGTQITTASQQNPDVDFAKNNAAIRVMDVNADGLVDIVFSSGTEYQTFFSLGRFPGGYTQYGHWDWRNQKVSNDPATSCLPWDAAPALLSDPDVHVADMNGDGLPDLVRVRGGDVRYWPGRGNGYWGTGDPASCPGGTYGQNQNVVMTASPQFGVVDTTETLLVDDINGDGLDDIVKIEFNTVYVWLNVDGVSWAGPQVIQSAPVRVPSANRVRLVDINGSGTRDLLYGDGHAYRYMDLNGGERPWVLTQYQNGKGATTSITYGTSTQMMLADAAATPPAKWSTVAPMPLHVVTQVRQDDNLSLVGRPEGSYVTTYSYRDPLYDGRQREFRGFASVTETSVGDINSPTDSTTTTFLLGQCENDESQSTDPCGPDGLWEDNPREALKGLPLVSETFDANGTYDSTTHHTYRLRKLYSGMDGREVRTAFESQTDTFPYDTSPFHAAVPAQQKPLTDVERETTLGSVIQDTTESISLRATLGTAHVHRSVTQDYFGNTSATTDDGCIEGCGPADESITKTTIAGLPPGDPSGWAYRQVESYITGSQTAGRLDDFTTSYDVYGEPVETDAALGGTIPLDRFHQSGAATAGNTAPAASQDGTRVVSKAKYDPTFGTLIERSGPNGRCRQITYDASYKQLPVLETEYVGPSSGECTGTPLNTIGSYDRGFSVVVSVTDLHSELSQVQYDGLGRTTAFFKPDPSQVGQVSSVPAVQVQYVLASASAPYSTLHTQTIDGATQPGSAPALRDSWAYVDGLDRTIANLTQADPNAGDAGQLIASGLTALDAKGRARLTYLSWFMNATPTPGTFPFAGVSPPTTAQGQRYDAFGRGVQSTNLDGTIAMQSAYHALAVDHWDAADLMPGPHQGTYATAVQDGHGRTVAMTERIHHGATIEGHTTATAYNAAGDPLVITRSIDGSTTAQVQRWMQYDTLGRMVLNVEPDTTGSFGPPGTDPGAMKAWRYAYNDSGDLVGTSDARGCGANYYYDAGGRIVAEDFSPCLASQAPYSTPDLTTGDGTEAFYFYDQSDPDTASISNFPNTSSFLLGRLASLSDRGSKTVMAYDGRGRVTAVARRMAAPNDPGVAADTLAERYTEHWYLQTSAYDLADRVMTASTGIDSDVASLLGADGTSAVTTTYAQNNEIASVGSSYGSLIGKVVHAADDLVTEVDYGDGAKTTTSLSYDSRRRPSTILTYRSTPTLWTTVPPAYAPAPTPTGPPNTFQLLLQDTTIGYDSVDNPVSLIDYRIPSEWPAGAQPVNRQVAYDDLYRVSQVAYSYPQGKDAWVDPFAPEDGETATDPRLAPPSPHASFANRVLSESFQYDWLGNTTQTTDDANGFYDRSLGTITNGTAGAGPYQLQAASQGSSANSLSAAYDVAGNVISLAVQRTGTCLPQGSICSQRFVYDWDEVGRLSRARRWDLATPGAATDPLPTSAPAADLRYGYAADNDRTLKTAVDATGQQVHTVYVFGSLELRRTTYGTSANNLTPDFERAPSTEVGYLFGHGMRLARLEYEGTDVPTISGGQVHVLLELPDYLGSMSVVIDLATGELAEASTYRALGDADSDYRPLRWDSFREDYRFTGKEEDVEVGLSYFGERYYMAALGRWASPDPLTIHALGADLNVYAYVHGELLKSTDPFGLDGGGSDPPPDAIRARAPDPRITAGSIFAMVPAREGEASGVNFTTTPNVVSRAQQANATVFVSDPNSQVDPKFYVDTMAEAAQEFPEIFGRGNSGHSPGTLNGQVGGGAGHAGGQPGLTGPSTPHTSEPPSGGALMDAARAWNGDTERGNPAPPGEHGIPGGTGSMSAGALSRGLYIGAAIADLVTTVIGVGMAVKSAAKSGLKVVVEAFRPCGLCFAAGTMVLTANGERPIESIHVGERVVATDGTSVANATAVDPATWRDVRLVMLNPDGSGDVLNIETLRPMAWLEQAHVSSHGDVFVAIPEMGLLGPALVESVGPVPSIPEGPGNVVLSTVTHVNGQVHALTFDGSKERLDATANHPLYSREKSGWTAVEDLKPGDHVRTRSGWLTVQSNTPEASPKRVYNLEVEGAHSYYVGDQDILSHNADPCFHLHHSWPKYLGGAVKQELVKLKPSLHKKYHKGLDKLLPRRLGKAFYDAERGRARMGTLRTLLEYTRDFDKTHGTKLLKAMRANGFPL